MGNRRHGYDRFTEPNAWIVSGAVTSILTNSSGEPVANCRAQSQPVTFSDSMKWLQWSYLDAEKGSGGVEAHMRHLARELKVLGVDAQLSSDPHALSSTTWDVIHTHGSNLEIFTGWKSRLKNRQSSTKWVHTLHGLTYERMWACGEYFWPGGYKALGRELGAAVSADILFAIHPNLSVYKLLSKTNKKCVVCGNGWDPWTGTKTEVPPLKMPHEFWLFIGRGDDAMKGVTFLREALPYIPDFKLMAIPGSGFESARKVTSLGPQNPAQVRALLNQSSGLILPSLYEGLPLVVLEALAEGLPVVTTMAGGLKTLDPQLQGLLRIDFPTTEKLKKAVESARLLSLETSARQARAQHNRLFLKTWRQVAQTALDAVSDY